MLERRNTVCRICQVACDLVVTLDDGDVKAIHGNKDNPVYHGFSCIKGRAAGALLNAPSRLLHSVERQPDGQFATIASGEATQRVAERLNEIIAEHGPRSVALFVGTYCTINPLFEAFARNFMRCIGSPMVIDNLTIDQPGILTSTGLQGMWLAGTPPMDSWDALLLVGSNPVVSMNGGLGVNPARQLKQMRTRGMKLVVVDPRRSECAQAADIHLQCRPGQDPVIMAGLVRQLIADGLIDHDFVAAETHGIEALKSAVSPFTPEMVAGRAGIDAGDLVAAARILGSADRGAASFGTGANMSGYPTTVTYLGRVLTSLRGWWRRAGEPIGNPGVFISPFAPIAASPGPMPVKDVGEKMHARGVTASLAGIPVSAVPDEILTTGEHKIRAMIVAGGNPVLAWPDQDRTVAALSDLDLLVTIDPVLSATAEMADYVLAPRLAIECETNSAANEKWGLFNPGWGYDRAYAQVEPPVVEPPAGSDLREDWEFFFDLAKAMGIELDLHSIATVDPQQAAMLGTKLDMTNKPSTAEAWAIAHKGAPVAYEELRARSGPQFPDRPPMVVQPKPSDLQGRLELGATLVMEDLAQIANTAPQEDTEFPFHLISRRLNDVNNSCSHDNPVQLRKWGYNPAFMHPSDLSELGLDPGDLLAIQSEHSRIVGIAEADPTLRRGCVSMPHSWGRHPRYPHEPRVHGTNTGRLISIDKNLDPLTGQPLMSAVPVAVERLGAPQSAQAQT